MTIIIALITGVALILVAGGYFAYISLAPDVALKRTLGTAKVKRCTLHEVQPELNKTLILMSFEMSNPTLLPVTITDVDATLYLNGTDYNSITLPETSDPSINPEETKEILRLIQIQASPISSTPERHVFNVTIELKITAETSLLLFFTEEETDTLTHNQKWIVNTG